MSKNTKQFASYEQESVVVVQRITHKVRMKFGESAKSIMETLSLVPKHCVLSEVIGDDEHGHYEICGEMVFTEENAVR